MDGGADTAFRQTGLEDNNSRFSGVDRFRYYGELLRPELTNLHILTAAVGVPVWESSSVEVLYHYYHQDEPAPVLRNANLDADPLGRHRGIGHEADLVIGIEEWEHWEIELIGGVFLAGDAFGRRANETALLTLLKVNFNF